MPISETPFGFIPILEIDGKPLSESWAIYRYVAKLAGLNGKDAVEEAFIDQNSELFRGWFDKIFAYLRVRAGIDPGDKVRIIIAKYLSCSVQIMFLSRLVLESKQKLLSYLFVSGPTLRRSLRSKYREGLPRSRESTEEEFLWLLLC